VEAEWNRIHGIVPVYPPQRIFSVMPGATSGNRPQPTQVPHGSIAVAI